jgi:hypothetical protein
MTKIDQNSVFLGRETHIPNQFYIMVIYINFYILFKNLNFDSESKGDSFRVYQKMRACEKNDRNSVFLDREAHILDCFLHNGHIYKFLWVLKISNFDSKFKDDSLRLYRKTPVCGNN